MRIVGLVELVDDLVHYHLALVEEVPDPLGTSSSTGSFSSMW